MPRLDFSSARQVLAFSSIWPMQRTGRSKSLTGSLQQYCGEREVILKTIYNSQAECGAAMLNKKATDWHLLADIGSVYPSMEEAAGMYCPWHSFNSSVRTGLGTTVRCFVGIQHWNNSRLLCVGKEQ